MNADALVDVLSILIRSRELNGTDRFIPLALEFLHKLGHEHPEFPRLRAAIELHCPADPFLRVITVPRPHVPYHDPDTVAQAFVRRVIGMGRYETSHADGIVNRHYGDFHLSLREHPFPVSIAYGEMKLLRAMLLSLPAEPLRMLEIGTGFGVSSTFLAYVAHAAGRSYTLTTVDPFVEDRQTDHAAVEGGSTTPSADNLSHQSALALRGEFAELKIEQILDYSPRCFERPELTSRVFDFVFIDGNHYGEQPARDFIGCVPFTHARTVFALHDSHAEGVQQLLKQLSADEWTVTVIPSSCNLAWVTRLPDVKML